jgi:outer membrane protein OmpA-like peptidoglycan-associated protein
MKTLPALLVCLMFTAQAQTRTIYKSFEDTLFVPGDLIMAPRIDFPLYQCNFYPEFKDSILVIARFLKQHPAFKVEIGAHKENQGSRKANFSITRCRANAILNFLSKEAGVPRRNLVAKAYGASVPLVSDKEIREAKQPHEAPALHARNRRIEVKILKTK